MIMSRIIGTYILPIHCFLALSLDRAKFLYAFLHGDSIDLGFVICSHIMKIFHSNKAKINLPYGCLIQKLIILHELPFPTSIPQGKPYSKIGLATLTVVITYIRRRQNLLLLLLHLLH